MKNNLLTRTGAGLLAVCTAFALAGCDASSSEAAASSEAASSESAASEEASPEQAEDAYAYLADFSLSDGFDENGYLKNVRANDYVTLPELSTLALSAEANTVEQADVDDYINNILESYATNEEVTGRAAAEGDTANIDYVGTINGVEFDGGSASGYDLVLGSGTFIDGFEDQIIGHNPGDSFDVKVTFPENYQSEDLAGKDAVFATTLNSISEEVLPELTDAWVAENLSDRMAVSTVDELNSFVNDNLLFSQQADELYGQLYDAVEVEGELPEEVNAFFDDYYLYSPYQYSTQYGMTLDDFLTASGYGGAEAYLAAMQDQKASTIKQILIMQAIAEQKGTVCDTDTLNAEFEDYFGTTDSESYIEVYGENYLKMNVLHDIAMQNLIDEVNA